MLSRGAVLLSIGKNFTLTCRDFIKFIADYLSGPLSQSTRDAFEDHLADCPECSQYLHSYQATIA
jgi:anti-sigma factor RsiW